MSDEELIEATIRLIEMVEAADKKFRETSDPYWQGVKDGIRKALIVIATDEDEKKAMQSWQDTSSYQK